MRSDAKVLLVPSFKAFQDPESRWEVTKKYVRADDWSDTVQLTEAMLEWPICFKETAPADLRAQWLRAYRNCLRAMLALEPYSAAVSLIADPAKQEFHLGHLNWGQIYCEERAVASFTHRERDGRTQELVSITDWPDTLHVLEWSAERWLKFFSKKIATGVEEIRATAEQDADDASWRIAFAGRAGKHLLPVS